MHITFSIGMFLGIIPWGLIAILATDSLLLGIVGIAVQLIGGTLMYFTYWRKG